MSIIEKKKAFAFVLKVHQLSINNKAIKYRCRWTKSDVVHFETDKQPGDK